MHFIHWAESERDNGVNLKLVVRNSNVLFMISNDKDQTEFILLLANCKFAKILWNFVTRLIPQEFFAFNGEKIQHKKEFVA